MSWKNGPELRNNEAPRLGKEEGTVLPLSVPWESRGGMDGGKRDGPAPLGQLPHCPKGREKNFFITVWNSVENQAWKYVKSTTQFVKSEP